MTGHDTVSALSHFSGGLLSRGKCPLGKFRCGRGISLRREIQRRHRNMMRQLRRYENDVMANDVVRFVFCLFKITVSR